jgi:hypothetical protein
MDGHWIDDGAESRVAGAPLRPARIVEENLGVLELLLLMLELTMISSFSCSVSSGE